MMGRSRFFQFLGLSVLVLGLVVITMRWIDLPLAQWCFRHQEWPKPWKELRTCILLSEIFGHVFGVFLFMAAMGILDPGSRRKLGRFLIAVLLGGIIPNLIKMAVVRFRPRYFFSEEFTGLRENIWDTFGPCFSGFGVFESAWQSFPSTHSSLAFALATGLAWFYPRGRLFFFTLAFFAMVQRVVVGAHFPSDTICGALLGYLVACCILTGQAPEDDRNNLPRSSEEPGS